jgi:hypothetical protein
MGILFRSDSACRQTGRKTSEVHRTAVGNHQAGPRSSFHLSQNIGERTLPFGMIVPIDGVRNALEGIECPCTNGGFVCKP